MCAHDAPVDKNLLRPLKKNIRFGPDNPDTLFRKRGRPRKEVDTGTMIDMIKNAIPITVISRHFGVHRDTLYANFPDLIKEAYASYHKLLRERQEASFIEFLKEKRLKDAEKQLKEVAKQRYRKRYPSRRTF